MWRDIGTALALLLILEGLLPLLAPQVWLKSMREAMKLGPKGLRLIGIILTLTGAVMLQFVR